MTNNHVVSDATEITVTLDDGTSYKRAVLVGALVVVGIAASGLAILELGNLSRVDLDTQVMVLGCALTSESTNVLSGFVSATIYHGGSNVTRVQTNSAAN